MADYITRKEIKKATKNLTHGTKKKVLESFEGKKVKRKDFERGTREGKVSYETRRGISERLDKRGQAPEPRTPSQTQRKTTGFFKTLFGSDTSRSESSRSGSRTSRSSTSKSTRGYDKLREEFGGQKGPGYTSDRGGSSAERRSTSSDRGSSSSSRSSKPRSIMGPRKLH